MRENPIHPRVDYALYIKGLAYYESSPGILERWFKKDVTQRPPVDVHVRLSMSSSRIRVCGVLWSASRPANTLQTPNCA
jgi:hypothetical protein